MNAIPLNRLKSEQGFTLAGVMATVAIVVIVGFVLSQFFANTAVILSEMERKTIVNDLFNGVKFNLSAKGACTKNLGGRNIHFGQSISSGIYAYDRTTDSLLSTPVAVIGYKEKGVHIKDLKLNFLFSLADATKLGELEITFESGEKEPWNLTRKLPLKLIVNSEGVKECWTATPSGQIISNMVCEALTGGALNQASPDGSCTLAGGQWFKGTYASASCPAGAILPVAANSDENCRVILPPGFKDTVQKKAFLMADGSYAHIGLGPYLLSLDRTAKSCVTDWAADLPASSYTGAQVEILCMVP